MEQKEYILKKEVDYNKLNNSQLKDELDKIVKKHDNKKEELIKLLDKVERYEKELVKIEENYVELVDVLNTRINGSKLSDKIEIEKTE